MTCESPSQPKPKSETTGRKCIKCDVLLTDINWSEAHQSKKEYLCRQCNRQRRCDWDNAKSDAEYFWSSAKKRAQRKGKEREFTISIKDVQAVDTDVCPILGIPIKRHPQTVGGSARSKPDSKSIDRIDSTKGYIPGNIRIISWKANYMLSDCPPTIAEAQALLNYLTTTDSNGSQI
jgi:hypothetical protein